MGKIKLHCDWCGKEISKYPSHIKEHNFCSKDCLSKFSSKRENPLNYAYKDFSKNSKRFSLMNAEMNKDRMTDEVKQKLSRALYGRGGKTPYRKRNGRHEHRAVVEAVLGRQLLAGEVVHHIDGNRYNNAPDNLMVFPSQAEHAAYHAVLRKGAKP